MGTPKNAQGYRRSSAFSQREKEPCPRSYSKGNSKDISKKLSFPMRNRHQRRIPYYIRSCPKEDVKFK